METEVLNNGGNKHLSNNENQEIRDQVSPESPESLEEPGAGPGSSRLVAERGEERVQTDWKCSGPDWSHADGLMMMWQNSI